MLFLVNFKCYRYMTVFLISQLHLDHGANSHPTVSKRVGVFYTLTLNISDGLD